MIETTPALSARTQSSPSPASATGKDDAGLLSTDFQTFLEMLTAQARNQDPTQPIDSTEYAAQLAQFSMVEQQVRTNETLTRVSALLGAANMTSMAGWIGMEARVAAPVRFDGAPVNVVPHVDPLADKAFLVVRDDAGTEVMRKEIPVASGPFDWRGVQADGSTLADGVYNLSVESLSQGKVIGEEPVNFYREIAEAQMRAGETVLILSGGEEILATSVTALRAPAS